LEIHQLGCEVRELLVAPRREAPLNSDVLAFNPPMVAKPLT
jgi:hypothetical protein